ESDVTLDLDATIDGLDIDPTGGDPKNIFSKSLNVSGGHALTLSPGGVINDNGTILLNDGTIRDAQILITPQGALFAASGTNAVSGVTSNLTNNGSLIVESGSSLTLEGSLTNLDPGAGTLAGGSYGIGGLLIVPDARVVTNQATIG